MKNIHPDKHIDYCKMKLEIVSPTCISSGEKLTTKDYIYDKKEKKVLFLHEVKWHQFILENKLFDDYLKLMENPHKSLFTWLVEKNKGELYKKLLKENVIGTSIASVDPSISPTKNTLNDISCHVKTVEGIPYIPGSSIKGLIRAAILYKKITSDNICRRRYWEAIQKNIHNNTKKMEGNIDCIERDFLNLLKDRTGMPIGNVMQGVSCSDAYSVQPLKTIVLQKRDFNSKPNKSSEGRGISLFRECIEPNSNLSFTLTIDKRICQVVDIASVNDVVILLEEFFTYISKLQNLGFGKIHGALLKNIGNANAYLGGGTGILVKTLIYASAPNIQSAVEVLTEILSKRFKNGKHELTHHWGIAPHTLKGTTYNGQNCLLGLVRISKNE